jgi:predicted RecB family nuclease
MKQIITSELVEAYLQCHRKAFLIIDNRPKGVQHEYERILTQRADKNRTAYLESITAIASDDPNSGKNQPKECQERVVVSEDFQASCDAISQADRRNRRSHAPYEPILVVGTHSITKEQRIRLAFAGFVIGEMRRYCPKAGWIVLVSRNPQRIHLELFYPAIRTTIADLRKLIHTESLESPSMILNEHCAICPFHQHCLREAEEDTI